MQKDALKYDRAELPEFASWRSYENFARGARQDFAYGSSKQGRAFIETVLATCSSRRMTIEAGTILCRAQLNYEEQSWIDEDGHERFEIVGHGSSRMLPRADCVGSGRANPQGVACLYLANSYEAAISEMRPWFGAGLSVAQFRIRRRLKVINLTSGHGHFGIEKLCFGDLSDEDKVDPKRKQEAVWTDIDSAFSWPVSSSEAETSYRPTQVLAKAFLECGYDGLVYRSNFGDAPNLGYNIVLFSPQDAEIRNCAPVRVKKVKVDYEEIGNPWYLSGDAENTSDAKPQVTAERQNKKN